jgi:hypothetical protein
LNPYLTPAAARAARPPPGSPPNGKLLAIEGVAGGPIASSAKAAQVTNATSAATSNKAWVHLRTRSLKRLRHVKPHLAATEATYPGPKNCKFPSHMQIQPPVLRWHSVEIAEDYTF